MKRELYVTISYRNEIPVLSLEGQLSSMQQEKLFQAYQELPQERVDRVIIDFEKTEYVNSSGISVLIQLVREGKLRKSSFVFSGLNPHLRRVFDAVGFSDVILIRSNVEEASRV